MATKRPESERPSSGQRGCFRSPSISASCVRRSTSAWNGLRSLLFGLYTRLLLSDGFEDFVHPLHIDPLRFRAQGRDSSNSLRPASFSRGPIGAALEIGLV